MARADLLLDLVRAGARGDQPLFRKSLETLVSASAVQSFTASVISPGCAVSVAHKGISSPLEGVTFPSTPRRMARPLPRPASSRWPLGSRKAKVQVLAHVAGHPPERNDAGAGPPVYPASRAKCPRPATRILSASG